MDSFKFKKLIELVKLDKELYQFFSERAYLVSKLDNIEIEIENIQKEIEVIHKKLNDLQRKASVIEIELKNLDAQEIEKNRQLNNVSTTRQYYSLEHELEDIKKQKDNLENTLLSLLNEIQDLNLLYQDTVLNVKEKKENLIKDMQNFEKRLFDLDKQINLESDYRDKLELEVQQIMPEFLEQYSLLKSSVSNPAVKLRDSSCSACFYQLTLNELSKIKEHKIGRCQECYRFLYL